MQGISGGGGGNSAGLIASRQLVALTTGTAVSATAKPIIGPPMTMRSVSPRGAPSASRAFIGVPIGASKLPGRA